MDTHTTMWVETDLAEIPGIVARLAANAPHVARSSAAERVAKLRQLYQVTFDHRAEIAQAGFEELGMNGMLHLLPLKDEVEFACAHLAEWMRDEEVPPVPGLMGRRAYVKYEPKGVVLHIATWNSPVLISLSPAVSAIAAGNVVVIKPSEIAPHAADIVRRIIGEVFAPDEVAVVTGGVAAAQALLAQPVNHICYVGNNRVGRLVMRAAAEHFANVTLEMGGKNPAIVDASADVADAAAKIAFGRCLIAGQVCLSPDYVLVHESKLEAFLAELGARYTVMFNPEGRGFAASADLPRIVNHHHTRRIKGLIDDAVGKGAKIVFGGEIDEAARFISPTVLTGVSAEMEMFQEEIFGPVLAVQGFASREEAVAEVAKRPKPLGLYVFANAPDVAAWYLDNTRAGTSAVNNTVVQANVNTLPFGGSNHSGIGRLGGRAGFVEFSNTRAVVEDAFDPAGNAPMFYPPYPAEAAMFVEQMLTPGG
jgi:aldehyde dehydrogenase (NAD+)